MNSFILILIPVLSSSQSPSLTHSSPTLTSKTPLPGSAPSTAKIAPRLSSVTIVYSGQILASRVLLLSQCTRSCWMRGGDAEAGLC